MKYSLLAVVMAALMLSACEYKKHPMDKPPPSAMVDRESAPNFDELDKEAGGTDTAGSSAGKEEAPAVN